MTQQYTMTEANRVAQQAARDIEAWLRKFPETRAVTNVEEDAAYRQMDVDLIWETKTVTYKIEIKGDRYFQTGNFFLETHSNAERGTPGCFLYTQADFVYYYFVVPQILFILPMPATREWFLKNQDRFRERSTTTPVGNGAHYTTIGRLVPRKMLLAEVQNVREVKLGSC